MGEKKWSTPGLDGSGQRAMRVNEEALADIEKKMAVLSQRASNGETVDREVRKLVELREKLKTDRGLILEGGM